LKDKTAAKIVVKSMLKRANDIERQFILMSHLEEILNIGKKKVDAAFDKAIAPFFKHCAGKSYESNFLHMGFHAHDKELKNYC
jgi:hypothetical protein